VLEGELAQHHGVVFRGSGVLSMTDSTLQASVHPGEHGCGIVVLWGVAGWKESKGEGF